jgi:hypothetical protein
MFGVCDGGSLNTVKKEVSQNVNWIGAGLSLLWMLFFIICMFVRTNLPETQFAVRFLNGGRVLWTLSGSFFALLVLSMVVSGFLERAGHRKNLR